MGHGSPPRVFRDKKEAWPTRPRGEVVARLAGPSAPEGPEGTPPLGEGKRQRKASGIRPPPIPCPAPQFSPQAAARQPPGRGSPTVLQGCQGCSAPSEQNSFCNVENGNKGFKQETDHGHRSTWTCASLVDITILGVGRQFQRGEWHRSAFAGFEFSADIDQRPQPPGLVHSGQEASKVRL